MCQVILTNIHFGSLSCTPSDTSVNFILHSFFNKIPTPYFFLSRTIKPNILSITLLNINSPSFFIYVLHTATMSKLHLLNISFIPSRFTSFPHPILKNQETSTFPHYYPYLCLFRKLFTFFGNP